MTRAQRPRAVAKQQTLHWQNEAGRVSVLADASVLTQVIEARAKATQVQVRADQLTDPEALRKFQEAQAQLGGALGRLIGT